jgi:hypothetical protein
MPPAPLSADPPPFPDPNQDQAPASSEKPSRATRLLNLVRKVIDFGKEVAHSLQQQAAVADPFRLARRFDTTDIPLILARIARGLRLAAGLEARLISHPPPETPSTRTSAPPNAASQRAPRTAQPSHRRARLADDPRLAALPSAEEIAAACRRRPIGAVLADICRDIGITAGHPLWRELNLTIMENGGNATAVLLELFRRGRNWIMNSPHANIPFVMPTEPHDWHPTRPYSAFDWAAD